MNYVERIIVALIAENPNLNKDLAEFYALLVLIKGHETTQEDVHDAWSIWQSRIRPDHRSIKWFGELSPAVQDLDQKYVDLIHKVALDSRLWS